jgi:hypothetical protein
VPAAPKVFVSYSHDDGAHKARVLAFADRLRNTGGVEAIIDRSAEPFPPEGWPAWCWWQIEQADFLVMVCTEVYHRRVTMGISPTCLRIFANLMKLFGSTS